MFGRFELIPVLRNYSADFNAQTYGMRLTRVYTNIIPFMNGNSFDNLISGDVTTPYDIRRVSVQCLPREQQFVLSWQVLEKSLRKVTKKEASR
jgi:hypothetical protein